MNDDIQLLRDYAEHGVESAFAAIVEKYLKLVYATAVRQIGDPEAAKDVTQAVFCLLAAKAGQLHSGTVLVGWLYQTTCFKSSCYKRAEARRALREKEGGLMLHSESNADEGIWTEIAPLLDEALHGLRNEDRLLILLRFFQQKPLREVGRELGIGEDAARMRVQRVVERLRDFLGRKGVACSGAALAVLLSERASEAAPAVAAEVVVKAALATAATAVKPSALALWLSRLLAMKGKLAAAGSILSLAVACYCYFLPAPQEIVPEMPASPMADTGLKTDPAQALVDRLRASIASSNGFPGMSKKDIQIARENLRTLLYSPVDEHAYPSRELSLAVNGFAPAFELSVPVLEEGLTSDRELVRKRAACLFDNLSRYVQRGTYPNFKMPVTFTAFATQPLRDALLQSMPTLREALRSSREVTTQQRLIDVASAVAPEPILLEDIVEVMRGNPRRASSIVLTSRHVFVEQSEPARRLLVKLLHDSSSELRWCAAYCLAALPGEKNLEALPVLVSALDGSNNYMSLQAVQSYGAEAKPWFGQLLTKKMDSPSTQNQFYKTLQAIDPEGARQLPEYQNWLQQQQETEAAKKRINDADASVSELITDLAVRETRYLALDRLSALGPAASAALPALRRELTNYTFAESKSILAHTIKKIDPASPTAYFGKFEIMPAINVVTKWAEEAMPQIQNAVVQEVSPSAGYTTEELAVLATKLGAIHPHCRELFVAQLLEKDPSLRRILTTNERAANEN